MNSRRATFLTAAILWPVAVWAQTEGGHAGGFLAGLHHPISGLDQILAMASVGLWGAQLCALAIWIYPVIFPVVMAFGGTLGFIGVPLPGVEIRIAISGIILGIVVLSEWRPPLWIAAVIVGVFATRSWFGDFFSDPQEPYWRPIHHEILKRFIDNPLTGAKPAPVPVMIPVRHSLRLQWRVNWNKSTQGARTNGKF